MVLKYTYNICICITCSFYINIYIRRLYTDTHIYVVHNSKSKENILQTNLEIIHIFIISENTNKSNIRL